MSTILCFPQSNVIRLLPIAANDAPGAGGLSAQAIRSALRHLELSVLYLNCGYRIAPTTIAGTAMHQAALDVDPVVARLQASLQNMESV
jgi:hypothetical protein